MRRPPAVPPALLTLLEVQDGAVTRVQALAAGLTLRQIRTLVGRGWTRPLQGVLVAPNPRDPFRTSIRAALLAYPGAVVCGVTAARLHRLEGLCLWTSAEIPHLMLPVGHTYEPRFGVQLHSGLRPGDATKRAGFPTITLARTVRDMAQVLALDDLVCLVDSALRARWLPVRSSYPGQRTLRIALTLADKRSESTFETLLRLLLVREGLAPETLQFKVYNESGREIARLDMAWPSVRLAVEADGRQTHDAPPALYRDRVRANDLGLEGWMILRFTWKDLKSRPYWIIDQVRRALNRFGAVKQAG